MCLNLINNLLSVLSTVSEHCSIVSALRKMLEHSTASRAPEFFLHAGNNAVVHKNITEHAEPLFIALINQCIN